MFTLLKTACMKTEITLIKSLANKIRDEMVVSGSCCSNPSDRLRGFHKLAACFNTAEDTNDQAHHNAEPWMWSQQD